MPLVLEEVEDVVEVTVPDVDVPAVEVVYVVVEGTGIGFTCVFSMDTNCPELFCCC